MNEHHELSPSHYNPWSQCTLWESDNSETSQAKAGTKHHEEMAHGLLDSNYEPETAVARWAVSAVNELLDGCLASVERKLTGSIDAFSGVYGTTDVMWIDSCGGWHFADLKSFSDGSENYIPQLMGYACLYARCNDKFDQPVHLHVLHGGVMRVDTIDTTLNECYESIYDLLKLRKDAMSGIDNGSGPRLNHYCQYCSKKGECEMVGTAITQVGNSKVSFNELSLPKKLVVCDDIINLVENLRESAKREAIENGGIITDGEVTYKIVERAGRGKVRDLTEVAAAIGVPEIPDKSGTIHQMNGISVDDLLAMCDLNKSSFIAKMKEVNADCNSVPKKNIEAWCASFYEKGKPTPCLVRAK